MFETRPLAHLFYVCEAIDSLQRDAIEGPMNKRGWALQERALACRTINITEKHIYWEGCQRVRCGTAPRLNK